jgi:predicted PurR-regulated permease PerM
MSSTTIPTRTRTSTGRSVPRAAVTALVAALAVAIVAVLALVALPDVVGGSQPRPTTAVDARDMPTPQWLERYLDPQVTDGGSGDPTALGSSRSTKGGVY